MTMRYWRPTSNNRRIFQLSSLGPTIPPETADEKLPNSLEDGEEFGMEQSFLLVPFLAKRHKQEKNATEEKDKEFHGSALSVETNLSY